MENVNVDFADLVDGDLAVAIHVEIEAQLVPLGKLLLFLHTTDDNDDERQSI